MHQTARPRVGKRRTGRNTLKMKKSRPTRPFLQRGMSTPQYDTTRDGEVSMTQPYLLRLSQPMKPTSPTVHLAYDERRQVSVVAADFEGPPAVTREDVGALGTKKADIEKGEDQKDRWR